MEKIFDFVVRLVVILLMGGLTAFLMILNAHKEEIWREIYESRVKK